MKDGTSKRIIWMQSDGLVYETFQYREHVNDSGVELYYSKLCPLWRTPGELAAYAYSDGNGYDVKTSALEFRLNYGDAYDLYLMLKTEFENPKSKTRAIKFKPKKLPTARKS